MTFSFSPPSDVEFDEIEIRKKRGDLIYSIIESLRPSVRMYNDSFYEPDDLYQFCLWNNGEVVYQSNFLDINLSTEREIDINKLFHPEEVKGIGISNNDLAVVLHQSSNINDWWKNTRTWLVRIQDKKFTLNDSLFWPKGQEEFNYNDLELGDLYIVPTPLYKFLSYMSLQIEKPFYDHPDTIPKAYSIHELITTLEVALADYNAIMPETNFHFMFGKSLDFEPVPLADRSLIIELAVIEALKANAIYWIEFEFEYSSGVDISVNKYDKYKGYLESLRDNMLEKIDKYKTKYLGKGVTLTNKFGFMAPFGMHAGTSSRNAPYLSILRDIDNARQGVFENQRGIFQS